MMVLYGGKVANTEKSASMQCIPKLFQPNTLSAAAGAGSVAAKIAGKRPNTGLNQRYHRTSVPASTDFLVFMARLPLCRFHFCFRGYISM
jgi:hypothetical protein